MSSESRAICAPVPITDINEAVVQEVGKFAVNEHNKEACDKLVFQRVVKGERQVVTETIYIMVVEVKTSSGEIKLYKVKVIDFKLRPCPYKLISFELCLD